MKLFKSLFKNNGHEFKEEKQDCMAKYEGEKLSKSITLQVYPTLYDLIKADADTKEQNISQYLRELIANKYN